MKYYGNRTVGFCCLVLLTLVGACSSDGADLQGGTLSSSSSALTASPFGAPTLHQLVRAGADNLVRVSALPLAACVLHSSDTTSADQGVDVVTNEEGMVSFRFNPIDAGITTKLSLDCQDGSGSAATYSVELEATSDAPLLVAPPHQGPVRPALTGDPLALSQDELIARGYPPRPDPANAPERYSKWLKHVSRPMIAASAKPVPVPRKHFGTWTSYNWGGYFTLKQTKTKTIQPQGPFGDVYAMWTIPSILGCDSSGTNDAAFWVGFGGLGKTPNASGTTVDTGGLWQAGMNQEVDPVLQSGKLVGTIVYTSLWYELVAASLYKGVGCCSPNYLAEAENSAYGDELYVEVWLSDVNWHLTVTGKDSTQYIMYYIADDTEGFYFANDGSAGQEAPFTVSQLLSRYSWGGTGGITGNSAEWIMEDVGDPLAQFSDVAMQDAYYMDLSNNSTLCTYGHNNPTQAILVNTSGRKLETVTPTSSTVMTHHWLRSK